MSKKIEEFKRKKAAQKQTQNKAFLLANREKENVTCLESGVQYEVIESGYGKVFPSTKDWVTTHYKGVLTDGKVFDSSLARNKPATFKLNNLIAAWQEILPLMVEGDKWRIVVPPNMGYGDRQEGKIPSNSILIFEIKLLGIGK